MDINKRIGSQLRKARKEKGLSLEQVADLMGVKSRNTISIMELGTKHITVEELVNYCEVLGISWIEVLENAK